MITPVGAVGKVDEASSAAKPLNDDLRTAQAAATFLQQAPALEPIPPVYIGGDTTVGDFIYNSTGQIDTTAHPSGTVSVPGVGVFPGLTDASYTSSPVRYEIKVGGVLVARVHDNGVVVSVEGFDFTRMGFPSSEERGQSGSQVAAGRLEKLTAYLSGLPMSFDVTDGAGNLLAVNPEGQPVTAPHIVAEKQITPLATPFGTVLQESVRLTQITGA
ncbi:hypothetical protein [Aquabacter cavernae]|uniref:hypothetical protein n=1 Tax=Aquabacter cavernae TaxID=2496029 RepID=UPI000F8C35FC|nr:hypothetical protein [Aquabacter cavernae]